MNAYSGVVDFDRSMRYRMVCTICKHRVLLWYLQEKNCPFPTQEESRKGSQFVVERIIKDFFGGKR